MDKKKDSKKSEIKIGAKYATKMTWGGVTNRGYIHYETDEGEKISLPLSKTSKE